MTDRELMQQALENCRLLAARHRNQEWAQHILRFCEEAGVKATALRERLAQPEQKRPQNCGTSYCSCIECVMEKEQSPLDRMAENARELGLDYEPVQEPVAHSIVAGALFDFMGWLTTRRERLVLSGADDAAPAADAIKHFARMRSLTINDAQVQKWQEHLATPPRREWVGLTEEDKAAIYRRADEENWHDQPLLEAVEAKLREKNSKSASALNAADSSDHAKEGRDV